MKLASKGFLPVIALAFMLTLMTGCVEHRYYRQNHRHSPDWERRHHRAPRVDVNIHN